MKKPLLGLFLCLTWLAVCSAPASAQGKGFHPQTAKTTPSPDVKPAALNGALREIFSNLGTRTDAFDSSNGYLVSGLDNGFNGQKQDIAIPFRPHADSTIIWVRLALQYYGYGANFANVAIYSDAGGLPGTALARKDVRGFLGFGSGCCGLEAWKVAGGGVPVTKGVQYWVVGTTDSRSAHSVDIWDFVWDDAPGTFAVQQDNGGWILMTARDGYPPPAVLVAGTVP